MPVWLSAVACLVTSAGVLGRGPAGRTSAVVQGEVSANSQPHILTVALFSLPCTNSPVIKDPAAVNSSPTIPHHLASPHLTHLLTLFPSALLGLGKDHALT